MVAAFTTLAKRLIPKNQFGRGISLLVGGTAGAQILLVLGTPLLTRLYTPDDFGIMAVYAGLLGAFGAISALRYELAIPISNDDKEASHVTVLCLLTVLVTSALVALLISCLSDEISILLGTPSLSTYIWLLPIGVLFSGIYNTAYYVAIRAKNFNVIAATRLKQSFASLLTQLIGYSAGTITLLFGTTAGQSLGSLRLYSITSHEIRRANIEVNTLISTAYRFRTFPQHSTISTLVNTVGLHLPSLIIASLVSPIFAGFYSLAIKVIQQPTALLGGAVSSTFLAFAPEARRNGSLIDLLNKLHERILIIGAPILLFAFLFSEDLFPYIFGKDWSIAGEFAKWLSISVFFQTLWSPLSTLTTVLNLERHAMWGQVIALTLRIVSLAAPALLELDHLAIIISFSIANSMIYYTYLLWFYNQAGISVASTLTLGTKTIIKFSLFALPALVTYNLPNTWQTVVSFIILAFTSIIWYHANRARLK